MATTERDFYVILGVERNATDAQIKAAFRKAAQKWHPDVNSDPEAQERFKEINEAYQVLSDPTRRQQYDMFGRAGVSGGAEGDFGYGGFGGFGDIFDAFFGGAQAGATRRGRPQAGADLRYDLRIS
ncbi:MAG: DnaJ domain-containing protein, partial [Chloroflexota bacterium]